jgi:UbiD family decarboxylase
VRLGALPAIQAWPEDGGPFLTLPLVYTEHPETVWGNVGLYRNQIYDDRTLGMKINIQRGGGFHHHAAEQLGRDLPVHLFLGGPPALILAAVAPLPENVPELVFASMLAGERIPIARMAEVGALPIAAEAEFLLTGRIPCGRRRLEGPFGDHYGYYARAHEFPIMEVDRLFHRREPVFPATVVGRPRQEDHWIGEYLQELFGPIFPLVLNGVLDVWAYDDAGVHPLASAVVRERYPREAFMAALRVLGEGQLSLTKFLLATDARLELRDFRRVLVHVLERADFATDLFVFSNVAQDTLDYTGPALNRGSKAVLLGLGQRRHVLRETVAAELRDPRFARQRVFAPGVLVVQAPPWRDDARALVQALVEEPAAAPFRLVCLVDDAEQAASDDASFLWTVFTRMEPAADIHARRAELRRFHVALDAPVVFDCRIKPGLPPLTEPAPETVTRVDARWGKLFPQGCGSPAG